MPGSTSGNTRKISFPADSVLCAVIQDGDVCELCKILHNQRGEFNINQTNHVGLTALHHAVLSNNLDAVKMLLCGDSDVNAQDVHGFSPLHAASACGFLQISSILLVFGADVFSLTKEFELPVDLAKDISIVRLLTSEMYIRIHNELYIQTFISTKVMYMWLTFRKIVVFVVKMLHTMFKNLRQQQQPAVGGTTQVNTEEQVGVAPPVHCNHGNGGIPVVAPVTSNGGTQLTLIDNNNKQKKRNKPMVKIE